MTQISATELARNLPQVRGRLEFSGEEVAVTRKNQPIARILTSGRRMTALEAMADLYRTLPDAAGAGWLEDSARRMGEAKRAHRIAAWARSSLAHPTRCS